MSRNDPQEMVRDSLLENYKVDYDEAENLVSNHKDLIKRRWKEKPAQDIADEIAFEEGLRER